MTAREIDSGVDVMNGYFMEGGDYILGVGALAIEASNELGWSETHDLSVRVCTCALAFELVAPRCNMACLKCFCGIKFQHMPSQYSDNH